MTNPLIVAALSVAVLALAAISSWLSFRSYRRRGCSGRAWMRAFPGARPSEIRDFLKLFVQVFGFRERWMLKFLPGDEVLGILRKRYPSYLAADPYEMEEFSTAFQKRYGVSLASFWREDITLGELFGTTRPAA
jgi:hypothetical protein